MDARLQRKVRAGFTLIELLVVVVILGILAALALPKFDAARDRAKFGSLKSALRSVSSQQEIYYNRFSRYADNLQDLEFVPGPGITVSAPVLQGGANSDQGWTASATHTALDTNMGCVIYGGMVGTAITAVGATATRPGAVACAE